MSMRSLGRANGIVMSCDQAKHNPNAAACSARSQTANTRRCVNREWAKSKGWGRGLCKGRKTYDLCPAHLKLEIEALKTERKDREIRKAALDEARKSKMQGVVAQKSARKLAKSQRAEAKKLKMQSAAATKPRSARKRRSPSADSAPAPA